jgi:hypothetical protein
VMDSISRIMPIIPQYLPYMLHWPALFSNSVVSREILQVVGYQNRRIAWAGYDYAAGSASTLVAFIDFYLYVSL